MLKDLLNKLFITDIQYLFQTFVTKFLFQRQYKKTLIGRITYVRFYSEAKIDGNNLSWQVRYQCRHSSKIIQFVLQNVRVNKKLEYLNYFRPISKLQRMSNIERKLKVKKCQSNSEVLAASSQRLNESHYQNKTSLKIFENH